MTRNMLFSAVVAAGAAAAECAVLMPGRTEVVVEAGAKPVVVFAADEMTNFLSRVLGAPVPVVSAPSGGGTASLILGEGELAKAAGVAVGGRARDSFAIAAKGNRIYIVGRDDPKFDIRANLRNGDGHGPLFVPGCERATLFGVYDFLELEAGCRFYFPDELGEIVPRRDEIRVADGERVVTPSFLIRDPYFGGDGRWFCETDPQKGRARVKSMEWLRLRMATMDIPCCHGSQWFRIPQRFAKTHPEYLALKQNGDRYDDPTAFAAYQYCWSNPGLQETLYQDVKAYLTGQPASSRGLTGWAINCRERYVDIMPDDSFQGCWCKGCQAAYHREKGPHYATELIWGVTAKIAQRLQDEGIDGQICQMAYLPYGRVPDFALPTNVHCMVADAGPWSVAKPDMLAAGEEKMRVWAEKLGHKIWSWTYPHKFGQTAIKGLPSMGPRAWGAYYKRMAPYIFGSFAECESDCAFFNHLNYIVFSRVCWDTDVDVEAVIDEYHNLMFGDAAPEMKKFYDALETNWVYRITGRIAETELGPVASPPSARELWTRIYSSAERARLSGLFDAALANVQAGSLEARRIELVRRELFDGLVLAAEKWEKKAATVETDVYDSRLGYPLLATVNTHGKMRGKPPKTRTEIRLRRTKSDFIVEWDCEEPEMDKVKCLDRPDDDGDMWLENGVECWMNPSDDGKTVYQIILTSKGKVFDTKYVFNGLRAKGDAKWNSGAKRFVETTEKGWKARLEIPLSSLPWIKERFRANFCRNRNVEGCSEYVQTSRFADAGYGDFENYGTVIVPKETEVTVKFLESEAKSSPAAFRRLGAVSPNGEMSPFVFGGKLYRMELADPTRGLNIADPRICCEIREAATGRLVSSFAHGRCYYASAFAEDGRVYVTGTEMVPNGRGGKKCSGRILCFESTDLVNWNERLLFERAGFSFCNSTIAKGPDGYVLALESDTRPQCGVKYTMFFATSKDFKIWTRMDDSLAFPQKWYAGGPFMVYRNGWYYLSLVAELPCERYGQYLYRTKDFRAWEVGRWNPFLLAHPDDRKISPCAHSLDEGRRAEIAKAFVCSAADLEMCDFDGKTYMVYGIGDQHGFYYFAEAWYDGSLAEFLESHFR